MLKFAYGKIGHRGISVGFSVSQNRAYGFCNVPDVTYIASSTLRWTVLLSNDITSKDISEVGLLRHTAALPLMVHT